MGKLTSAVAAAALGLAVTACSAIERQETQSTEQMLAAAGFQMRPADSPERLAQISAMSQHTLLRHDVGGEVRYVYADAKDCKCLYAGGEAQYDEFQKLQTEQRIAEENQAAAMDWNMWGPWGGFGWDYVP